MDSGAWDGSGSSGGSAATRVDAPAGGPAAFLEPAHPAAEAPGSRGGPEAVEAVALAAAAAAREAPARPRSAGAASSQELDMGLLFGESDSRSASGRAASGASASSSPGRADPWAAFHGRSFRDSLASEPAGSEASELAEALHEMMLDAAEVQTQADEGEGAEVAWLGKRAPGVTGLGRSESMRKLGLTDFELLRVVGQGAFGKVFQVRRKDTGAVYAMKVLKKARILQKDHMSYLQAERTILTSVVHPFIVTLRHSFQCPTKLYMVMDFVNGGHLFFQLYNQGIFTEEQARLYTAEIVQAVAHLHSLGFVHRDLKPENVLLDAQGHVKITDFGLSKGDMTDEPSTNSLCGTIEYMAPEIIKGKGHGKGVDWWSVGILLYEMLNGLPPFRSNNKAKLQKQIAQERVKLPTHLTSDACSLLKGLLHKDPTKRLGYGEKGSEDVMKHPFFKPINWRKLEKLEVPPLFIPDVNGHLCVQNFDSHYTEMPIDMTPYGTPVEEGLTDDPFKDFSYSHPSFLAEHMAGEGVTTP